VGVDVYVVDCDGGRSLSLSPRGLCGTACEPSSSRTLHYIDGAVCLLCCTVWSALLLQATVLLCEAVQGLY